MSASEDEPSSYLQAALGRADDAAGPIWRALNRARLLRETPTHHPGPGPLDPDADLLECGAMAVDVQTDQKDVLLAEPDVEAPEDHGEAYIIVDQDDLVSLPWWDDPFVWGERP